MWTPAVITASPLTRHYARRFLCAHRELGGGFDKHRRTVAIPVDLRRRMTPEAGDVLCLYVGSVLFEYDYDPGKSFWDNTKRIHALFTDKYENEKPFRPFHNLERLDHTLLECMLSFAGMSSDVPPGYARYEETAHVYQRPEEHGRQDAGQIHARPAGHDDDESRPREDRRHTYGGLTLERLYFIPSTGRDIPLVLGAVTVGDALTVSVNYIGRERETLLRSVTDLDESSCFAPYRIIKPLRSPLSCA